MQKELKKVEISFIELKDNKEKLEGFYDKKEMEFNKLE